MGVLTYLMIIGPCEIENFFLGLDVPDLDRELVVGQGQQAAQVLALARASLNRLDGVAALVLVHVIDAQL